MVAIWGCGNGRGKRSKSTTDQTVPFCRIKLSFSRESDHDSVTDESSIQSISFNVLILKKIIIRRCRVCRGTGTLKKGKA